MSSYTDVLLSFNDHEPERSMPLALEYVQAWLWLENHPLLEELKVELVYGGSFRNLDRSGLIARVRSAPWQHPEDVQLLIRGDGETKFVDCAGLLYARPIEVASDVPCPRCGSRQTYQRIPSSWRMGDGKRSNAYLCRQCGTGWILDAMPHPEEPPRTYAAMDEARRVRDLTVEHRHEGYRGPPSECPHCK
jgi:hypothetical protein